MWDQVHESGDLDRRRAEIAAFNAEHAHVKRAIGVTPVKFGISFNLTAFNQGGALVHVYKDGSVLINHGGTEMGQGLHTKMMQVAATTLGVPLDQGEAGPDPDGQGAQHLRHGRVVRCRPQRGAVKNACEQIRERLERVAGAALGVSAAEVRFVDGMAYGLGHDEGRPVGGGRPHWRTSSGCSFRRRATTAPAGLHWDSATMKGSPFKYFAYGCCGDRGRGRRIHRRLPHSGASTSCTMWATACLRWSTSARSRAASSRAPGGSLSKTCGGTRATGRTAAG